MQEGFLVDVKGHGGMTTAVFGNREPSAEQIRQHNTRSDYENVPQGEKSELGVPCKPMNLVLKDAGGFDYVSLDCEGCEKPGVLTWSFEKNPAGIVQMEMMDLEMEAVMKAAGYLYLGVIVDHMWIKKGFIYEQNKNHWESFCAASDIPGWLGGPQETYEKWKAEMKRAKHQARKQATLV